MFLEDVVLILGTIIQNPIFSACNTHAKLVLGKATRFASIRFELYILAPDSVVGLIEPYASIQYYV